MRIGDDEDDDGGGAAIPSDITRPTARERNVFVEAQQGPGMNFYVEEQIASDRAIAEALAEVTEEAARAEALAAVSGGVTRTERDRTDDVISAAERAARAAFAAAGSTMNRLFREMETHDGNPRTAPSLASITRDVERIVHAATRTLSGHAVDLLLVPPVTASQTLQGGPPSEAVMKRVLETGAACAICLEAFKTTDARASLWNVLCDRERPRSTTIVDHLFHRECIHSWHKTMQDAGNPAGQTTKCPTCKVDISHPVRPTGV
jgi:hypothetical protein